MLELTRSITLVSLSFYEILTTKVLGKGRIHLREMPGVSHEPQTVKRRDPDINTTIVDRAYLYSTSRVQLPHFSARSFASSMTT